MCIRDRICRAFGSFAIQDWQPTPSETPVKTRRGQRSVRDLEEALRSKVVPHGFCMNEPLKKTALPVPCRVRFLLGVFWRPRRAQDGPKTRPRGAKTPQDAPKTLQDGPKTPPRRAKTAQEAPRRPQDAQNPPKMEPSRHQNGIKNRSYLKTCEKLKIL